MDLEKEIKESENGIINKDNIFFFFCPHCGDVLGVNSGEINCTIFRHGWYKDSKIDIPPHTPREECERLVREGLIDGCGKPFKFDGNNVSISDYI